MAPIKHLPMPTPASRRRVAPLRSTASVAPFPRHARGPLALSSSSESGDPGRREAVSAPVAAIRPTPVGDEGVTRELEAADRLVSDLAALVDAGLVVVHKPLGGPARYGVGDDFGEAA